MSIDLSELTAMVEQGYVRRVVHPAGQLEQRVEDLLDTSPLPAKPSYGVVNDWLVGAYRRHWGWG